MIYDCKSLIYLPDISKWNISNVYTMQDMFDKYDSLSLLLDITNLNTKNLLNQIKYWGNA